MTEEDLESDAITPEVLPEQQFKVMITTANLDESRANYLLQNFSTHFKEAAEWAKKAKDIVVTSENQTVMMEMARTGRLFLSKKRQEIEKARKWMKEPALREGQAIDKIANLLKDTIIPTEEHLRRQEDFIKIKKEAEEERIRLEIEKKMDADRIAKEQEEMEARSKLQAENESLRKAAEIKEEIDRKFREEKEKQLQEERNKTLRIERELQIKKQEELKKEADKIRAEEDLLKAGDQEKMIYFRKQVELIKIPEVKSAINKRIIEDARSHLFLAIKDIKIIEEE